MQGNGRGHLPSRFVRGRDFFLLSFFDLCSGTADFFLEEPPLIAPFLATGVSAAGSVAPASASAEVLGLPPMSVGSNSASPFTLGASVNKIQHDVLVSINVKRECSESMRGGRRDKGLGNSGDRGSTRRTQKRLHCMS